MEETQESRKKLIIKIYSSRPKNREGVCELKNKKGYYAEAIWIDVKSASKSRESNENAMRMDSCKKMQCWTMMKRLMVGRHAWVLKKNEQNKKVMSLKDIELKLKRLEYSKVDDFAYDMRNVFSYPLGYPPKSDIHKIAREITHDFEFKWKTMKKKWILEKPNL